ncbi:MAG: hypothetical protein IPK39_16280 [Sulfuritalea sp.]|nr:hypothetical protein [Sulfuritalea sp.]
MRPPARMMSVLLGLAALVPAPAADCQELGRLFFTPEKRATLDRQRTLNIQEAQTLQGNTMSLDGVVYRSNGKATVWINQQAQADGESSRTGVSAVVSPRTPGSAVLAPGEETPARLKVGETVNRATGKRDTRLGGGVVVTPKPSR